MLSSTRFRVLAMGLAALCLSGCKTRTGGGSEVEEAPPAPRDYTFVGCRPSVGECYNSCPDHRSQAKAESVYCSNANSGIDGDVECYCYTGGGGGMPPDPEGPQPANQP